MIVFNCSHAFAQFIEAQPNASAVRLVGQPAAGDDPSDVIVAGLDVAPDNIQTWYAHRAQVGEQSCALLMEAESGYTMVFVDAPSNDAPALLNAFATRLVNEMSFAAQNVGMLGDFEALCAEFVRVHSHFRFFEQISHEALAHLEESVRELGLWATAQALPTSHSECAGLDARLNDTPRSTQAHPAFVSPDEEMLCHWLKTYGGLTPAGEKAVRARAGELKRLHPGDGLAAPGTVRAV